MKHLALKFTTLLINFNLILLTLTAQSPDSFKYQAVVRDLDGNVFSNQDIGLQVEILQGSDTGPSVFTETHLTSTNNYGLINIHIGEGTVQSGNFTLIDWGNDSYFVRISIDITGGTAYTELGTSQLLSVPYALYAENTGFPNPWKW